jgi:hypothetical protein
MLLKSKNTLSPLVMDVPGVDKYAKETGWLPALEVMNNKAPPAKTPVIKFRDTIADRIFFIIAVQLFCPYIPNSTSLKLLKFPLFL